MRGFAACVLIFAAYVGWKAGDAPVQDMAEGAAGPKEAAKTSSVSEGLFQQASGGTLELRREWGGHFFVNADVAGHPVRFVVDTGATVVAMGRKDARRLGIDPGDGAFDQQISTASGTIRGARIILPRLRAGDIQLLDVPAVVLDIPDTIPMLGQSFLSRLDRVSIEGDRMMLVKG